MRDPDEAADGDVLEDRPAEDESAQDAAEELAERPCRRRRRARNELVKLPGIDSRAGAAGRPYGIAIPSAELHAPRDACRRRTEAAQRRNLAGQPLWHQCVGLRRQPPLLPVPVLRQRKHRRIASVR